MSIHGQDNSMHPVFRKSGTVQSTSGPAAGRPTEGARHPKRGVVPRYQASVGF